MLCWGCFCEERGYKSFEKVSIQYTDQTAEYSAAEYIKRVVYADVNLRKRNQSGP